MGVTLDRPDLLVSRDLDAARVNAVLNHPDVRPWVADEREGELDVSGAVADSRNYLLMGEHGGCLFFCLQPGVYEVHTQVLPAGRGRWTRKMTRDAVHWMFTRTDCYEILTRIPKGHVAAKVAAMNVGMRYEFSAQKSWFRGALTEMDIYSFRIQDWLRDAAYLEPFGEEFHSFLHHEAERLSVEQGPHGHYPSHNQYLGACLDMFLSGNTKKAVTLYNRWASAARHRVVFYVDDDRIKFDIGMLKKDAEALEVVRC